MSVFYLNRYQVVVVVLLFCFNMAFHSTFCVHFIWEKIAFYYKYITITKTLYKGSS